MVKRIFALLLIVAFVMMTACYSMTHVVGKGAQGGNISEQRQWFALWGLVPISEVNTQDMAGSTQDYDITTEFTPVDIVIGFFTSVVTVQPKTVRVTK